MGGMGIGGRRGRGMGEFCCCCMCVCGWGRWVFWEGRERRGEEGSVMY